MVVQTTEDDSTSSVHTRKDSNEASLVENSTDPSDALVRADSFDVEDSDKPKEEVRQFDALKRTAFEAATEEQEMSGKTRGRLLAAVCFLEIIANFDAGVLPATIGHVMSEFELNYADGGLLGALVYMGLVLGAPVAGWALTNFQSQRKLLVCAAVANCLGVLAFALAPNTTFLYIGRFLIGLTQAPLIIYMPVWVDEFAPPESAAVWMALLQASVAMGIMFGYVTAGLIVTYVGEEVCPLLSCDADDLDCHHDLTHGGHEGCHNPRWRIPLYIQAFGVLAFAPVFMFTKGRHINARGGPQGRIQARTVKHFHRLRVQYEESGETAPQPESKKDTSPSFKTEHTSNASAGLDQDESSTVWVGGIPNSFVQGNMQDSQDIADVNEALAEIFRQFGEVVEITVRVKFGENKNWAFCTFPDSETAKLAVSSGAKVKDGDGGADIDLTLKLADFNGHNDGHDGALADMNRKHEAKFLDSLNDDSTKNNKLVAQLSQDWSRRRNDEFNSGGGASGGTSEKVDPDKLRLVFNEIDTDGGASIPWTVSNAAFLMMYRFTFSGGTLDREELQELSKNMGSALSEKVHKRMHTISLPLLSLPVLLRRELWDRRMLNNAQRQLVIDWPSVCVPGVQDIIDRVGAESHCIAQELDEAIIEIDLDGDGEIDFNELLQWFQSGAGAGSKLAKMIRKQYSLKASLSHHLDGLDNLALGESIGLIELFGGGDGSDGHGLTLGGQLKAMATSSLFVSLTLALSGLYFVVTGIQYWVTDYLTLPVAEGGMGMDQGLVVICFSVLSLTGPTAGVFFGGWIIDKQGGYKCETGKAARDTLRTCCFFGLGAVIMSFPTAFGGDIVPELGFNANFWFIMVTMWFVLFFGGALLSPATGVCINSVHPDLRSFSSALSMVAYNILGYAAAPFACGVVGEEFGIKWGFRVALLASAICYLGLIGAYVVSKQVYADYLIEHPEKEGGKIARGSGDSANRKERPDGLRPSGASLIFSNPMRESTDDDRFRSRSRSPAPMKNSLMKASQDSDKV